MDNLNTVVYTISENEDHTFRIYTTNRIWDHLNETTERVLNQELFDTMTAITSFFNKRDIGILFEVD